MNKFFVLLAVVAASVALASAQPLAESEDEMSELSLNPNNDMETAGLEGTPFEAFGDFCKQTRDHVVDDIKKRTNLYASGVFSELFRTIGDISQGTVDANKKATEELSNQLRNPDAEIDESSEEQVDQIIAEGKKAIQQAGSQPAGIFAAFTAGIRNFAAAGYGLTVKKFNEFVEGAKDKIVVAQHLITFCEELANYEAKAIEIFEKAKKDLVELDAAQYSNVKYAQVAPKCMTANRLSRADGLCKFVLAAKDPIAKIAGIDLGQDSSAL